VRPLFSMLQHVCESAFFLCLGIFVCLHP
jgi:hypothetical protein